MDGGVLNNLPYQILIDQNIKKIIAINLKEYTEHTKINPKSAFNIINNSFNLMIEKAFNEINEQINNDNLFIFEPHFKKSFSNKWNMANLKKKI